MKNINILENENQKKRIINPNKFIRKLLYFIIQYWGCTRIELVTSRTQNENHTNRPTALIYYMSL